MHFSNATSVKNNSMCRPKQFEMCRPKQIFHFANRPEVLLFCSLNNSNFQTTEYIRLLISIATAMPSPEMMKAGAISDHLLTVINPWKYFCKLMAVSIITTYFCFMVVSFESELCFMYLFRRLVYKFWLSRTFNSVVKYCVVFKLDLHHFLFIQIAGSILLLCQQCFLYRLYSDRLEIDNLLP